MNYHAHPIHQMGGGSLKPSGNSCKPIDKDFQENFHSSKIELDLEAFEDHVLTEAYNLRDDFSCSSYSSSVLCASESTEFLSYSRIK